MEAITFFRSGEKKSNLQIQGNASQSALYALLSVTPEDEERIKNLPVYTLYQLPMQDHLGRRYFIPGIDPVGSLLHPIRPG